MTILFEDDSHEYKGVTKEYAQIRLVQRKIDKLNWKISEIKEKHGPTPSQNYTYHGGWNLGYYEGQLSIWETVLDKLKTDCLS